MGVPTVRIIVYHGLFGGPLLVEAPKGQTWGSVLSPRVLVLMLPYLAEAMVTMVTAPYAKPSSYLYVLVLGTSGFQPQPFVWYGILDATAFMS